MRSNYQGSTVFESQWFFIYEKVEVDGEVWCDYIGGRIHSKYPKFYTTFHSIMYCFLPFIVIIILNIIIIVQLILAKVRSSDSGQQSALSKKAVSTAILLLSVSLSFLVLTIPYVVVLIKKDVLGVEVSSEIWVYAIISSYINHSSNAAMYTFLGPKFRKEVLKLLCGGSVITESSVDHKSSSTGNRVGPHHSHDTEC